MAKNDWLCALADKALTVHRFFIFLSFFSLRTIKKTS